MIMLLLSVLYETLKLDYKNVRKKHNMHRINIFLNKKCQNNLQNISAKSI